MRALKTEGRMAGWLLIGLATLMVLLLLVPNAQARWQQLIWETFEYPAQNFPWSIGGNPWVVVPNSITQARWGIARGAIYHYNGPLYIQSLWCAGGVTDLAPGQDPYDDDMDTFARWGTFDLEDAVSGGGNFWLWAEFETPTNSGDYMKFLITDQTPPTDANNWDYLYETDQSTNEDWEQIPMDFDSVYTTGGDTVSYLGRDNITIAYYFFSDSNDGGRGVFVDDFAMGYDNGVFDFEADQIMPVNPENHDESIEFIEIGAECALKLYMTVHSEQMSAEVDHVLTLNGEPYDTLTGSWEGSTFGTSYELVFDRTWTAPDSGLVTFGAILDVEEEQDEWTEEDNEVEESYYVYLPDTEPTFSFQIPGPEGVDVDADSVLIAYDAHNDPPEQDCVITMFYDDDQEGFDGNQIPGMVQVPCTNQPDTLIWRYNSGIEGEFYVYAVVQDFVHEPLVVYSEGTLRFNMGDVEDPAGSVPASFELVNLYPNPFNPTVEMNLRLPVLTDVRATWYSIDGRRVARQEFDGLSAGLHRLTWTPSNLPSGSYLVRVEAAGEVATARAVYLK